MKLFWYFLGATFTTISASAPYRIIITLLCIYESRYAPGMSNMATYRSSCASNEDVMNTDYFATAGAASSYKLILSRCFLISLHARPFMSPLHFSFSNICESITFFFLLFFGLVASTEGNMSSTFSPVSYVLTAALPGPLNLLKLSLLHIVS